jgi:hypothetical protein
VGHEFPWRLVDVYVGVDDILRLLLTFLRWIGGSGNWGRGIPRRMRAYIRKQTHAYTVNLPLET